MKNLCPSSVVSETQRENRVLSIVDLLESLRRIDDLNVLIQELQSQLPLFSSFMCRQLLKKDVNCEGHNLSICELEGVRDVMNVCFQDALEYEEFKKELNADEFMELVMPQLNSKLVGSTDPVDEAWEDESIVEAIDEISEEIGHVKFSKFELSDLVSFVSALASDSNPNVDLYADSVWGCFKNFEKDYLGVFAEEGHESIEYHFDLVIDFFMNEFGVEQFEEVRSIAVNALSDDRLHDLLDSYKIEEESDGLTLEERQDVFMKRFKRYANKQVSGSDLSEFLELLGFESGDSSNSKSHFIHSSFEVSNLAFLTRGDIYMKSALRPIMNVLFDFWTIEEVREALISAGFKIKF